MRHLTREKYEKIICASNMIGSLKNGVRNKKKISSQMAMNLMLSYSTHVKKLPNVYKIVYEKSVNLGTKTYPDCYIDYWDCIVDLKEDKIKETEKSIILIFSTKNRLVIPKYRILCYVF